MICGHEGYDSLYIYIEFRLFIAYILDLHLSRISSDDDILLTTRTCVECGHGKTDVHYFKCTTCSSIICSNCKYRPSKISRHPSEEYSAALNLSSISGCPLSAAVSSLESSDGTLDGALTKLLLSRESSILASEDADADLGISI